METVYIETTVLSYLVSRPSRDIIVAARQELTREWWDNSRPAFQCVLSQIVLDEIALPMPRHHSQIIPFLTLEHFRAYLSTFWP